MQYRALAGSLVPVAEAARKHFAKMEGAKRFRAEEEIASDLSYRPTLSAENHDKSILAIEVNDGTYTNALDTFVVECLTAGLPIRLFVAVPSGGPAAQLLNLVRQARKRGIGVVEFDGKTVRSLLPAVSLSLFGVRPVDRTRYPRGYFAQLHQAEETFRNGDAAKGCGRVYDLIEKGSRTVATEIDRLLLWRTLPPPSKPRFRTAAWARVLEYVDLNADFPKLLASTVRIDKALWARVRGLTPHRNQSGHAPSTRKELQQRDQQLRTRFEHAVDTLADLVRACPLIGK